MSPESTPSRQTGSASHHRTIPAWLNTAAAMIGISSGIGTPRLPSKSTAKTPRYVKVSTNSCSASTASSPDERCYACSGPSCSVADPDRGRRGGALDHVGGRASHVDRLLVLQVISQDRKSTRLNSSHSQISYAVFCLKKKKRNTTL